MQKRKFFVCAVDSLENAKLVAGVYKKLLEVRDELKIEAVLLAEVSKLSGAALDFLKQQDIDFIEQVPVDENLKEADTIGRIYGLKFDDWEPCVVIFGINKPADSYFRMRFTELAQERGISILWIDKGKAEEVFSFVINEFLKNS